MTALKVLVVTGLALGAFGFAYLLWAAFSGHAQSLASPPSPVTVLALVCLLALWMERVYRLVLDRDGGLPLRLNRQWAREAAARLMAWTSSVVASGAILVMGIVLFTGPMLALWALGGLLLVGLPMFLLEQRHFRRHTSY